MKDTIVIEVGVRTSKVGSGVSMEVEFDREDWEAMDGVERDKFLFEEAAVNLIMWEWKEVTRD